MFREIRRTDRLATDEAGIALLKICEYGVLSVLGDAGYPYGVPVSFAFEDHCIYVHSFLDGHKIDAIQKYPKVCLTVVGDTEVRKDHISINYESVVVFGQAEVIPPSAHVVRQTAFSAIMSKYIPNEEERTTKYIESHKENTAIIRIEIQHMTCKRRSIK
jgi:nitroimidazol reductase NimA-like FMN-containing flavoprotein (pyridoxamine 5'-phosphate oxidase superfamily)